MRSRNILGCDYKLRLHTRKISNTIGVPLKANPHIQKTSRVSISTRVCLDNCLDARITTIKVYMPMTFMNNVHLLTKGRSSDNH